MKLEIKEEKIIYDDPLSIKIEAENVKETIKQEIEGYQNIDPFSCEQNADEESKNTIDIVEHEIKLE